MSTSSAILRLDYDENAIQRLLTCTTLSADSDLCVPLKCTLAIG